MKIGSKEKNLIIGLLGILIVAGVWMFVASPMKEKTTALQAENESLKVTKDEYEAINAQKAVYEQGIVDLTTEREELLENYPAGITKEDEIMYWANMERTNSATLALSDIAMSPWEEVFVDGYTPSEGEGASQLHLYKAPVSYTYNATYDGVKAMVAYVFAQNDKKSIESVNISFDESTGNLTGSMNMNMFYMNGTDKEYVPYTIPTVPTGVENVFRSTNTEVVTDAEGVSDFETAEDEE